MLRYVPGYIVESSAFKRDSGSFMGFVLFADIAGFTDLSNVFRKGSKKGAEALNQYLTQALSYPIELVEKQGGFVSHFAGDAFYAVFPEADASQLRYVLEELKSYFDEHPTIHTGIGDFPLQVRLAVSNGKVNWRVYRLSQQAEYVFSGKPFQEIMKLSEEKLELALSPSVQAAFDAVTTKLDIPKKLEFNYDEALERQFLNPRLHGFNPDNEIRDAGYCFIDMSWLKKDQIMPTLSLIHDKLDDYGGYLNKLDAGDKGLVALVLFGIPKAMGNTLERACRFALETIAEQPNLSIGLSCGNAYAGFVGSESTREYTALGSAVNLASRLMQTARKGEILTDSYIEQEMHHKYRFEPAATVTLKGFTAPVHCNNLIDRLPAPPQSFLTELVGRETELELIRQSGNEPGSRILYISGEPGIGKSRLILEALKPYPNRYFLFCDPSGHKLLEPIKQFLRQYFKYDPLLSREQNQKSFRNTWSELAGENKELIRIESIVGNLLGYEWEGSIWSMLPPEEKTEQQRKAFATLLARITESERIIIHLDDPQWLDASDLEYFRQLGTAKLEGVVIIAACRYLDDGKAVDLEIPNWDARHIDLNRLTEDASSTLITILLKVTELPKESLDWIVKKADGNPLFIEQVVAYLTENDCFDSEYKLKGNLDYLSSFGIADIIGSRIDSLTEAVRNTLQHACVLGLEFNTRILSEMLSRKLDDDLGEGKQARVWADIDELRYIFTHVLIKDTAYNRMLSDKLRTLHLLAAETMAKLYLDDEKALNEHAEEIAGHFENAGQEEQAAKYHDRAGCWYKEKYDWVKSESLLKAALEIRERFLGEENPDTAETLNNLAGLYKAWGRFHEAETIYHRALAIMEKVWCTEHQNTATTLNNLGDLYEIQGRHTDAERILHRALAIREKVLGTEHTHTAGSLNNLAGTYESQGRYTEAESLYLRALLISEKAQGLEHPETAQILNNLASLYKSKGKYPEAECMFLKALGIKENVLGTDHPNTAVTLNNLAGLYSIMGKFTESEALYLRSLDIREKVLGTEHTETAGSLNNLAKLYSAQRRYNQAESMYLRSIAINEKYFGAEHEATAISMNNLASVYGHQGRYAEAEILYLKSLEIIEKQLGSWHPITAGFLNNLGSIYYSQGKYADAEQYFHKSLIIKERVQGAEHPDTAISMSNLAVLYRLQGKYTEAEPLHLKALAINEKLFGKENPVTIRALDGLACLYHDQKKFYEAESLYLRSLEITEKVLGVEHPDIVHSLNNLAFLYQDQGLYDKAETMFLRSYAIRKNILGPEHPDTALSIHNLGGVYFDQGFYDKSESMFLNALKIRGSTIGFEHPDTQRTIKCLIKFYEKLDQPEKAAEYRAMLIDKAPESS